MSAEYTESELAMSHIDRIAWRKAGRIAGWEVFAWEVVDMDAPERDLIIQGGIPSILERGKRKGQKTWKGCKVTKVVITEAEVKAEKETYSKATGNCPTCFGKGEVLQSWSATEGIKYRPCKHCNNTGKIAA